MTEQLKKIKLTSHAPPSALAAFDRQIVWKKVNRGEYLFHGGDEPTHVFLVAEGAVKVVKEFPNGKNAILSILGPGSVVAEIAAIDEKPYPASGVAHEEGLVGVAPAAAFRALLLEAPETALAIIKGLGGKLRELTDNMGAMAVQTVDKRVARFLLKLGARIGEREGEAVELSMPMTRKELAEIIGATFEVVERSLKKMKDKGLLKVEGKRIVILDEGRLIAFVEE